MKKLSCLVVFAFFSLVINALETNDHISKKGPSGEWPLKFDAHASAFMGSSILSSINNALFWSEDRLIELSGAKLSQPWSGLLRSAELILFVMPVNNFLFLWQHEFFGHGARAREFGHKTTWPKFYSLPVPYGPGIAAISTPKETSKLRSLLITIGGVEGANVMAEDISMNWWRHKKINAKSAFMQFFASHNTDGYLWVFSPKFFDIPGHDMVSYINKVHEMYGDQRLGLNYMTWGVASNLLDPFLYFNFYSMYRYVVNGETNNTYPFIRFGENVSYLPAVRYVLSPFGPEYHLINYLSIYDHHIKAYGRYGSLKESNYYGLGASGDVWSFSNLSFGGELHVWRQPKMLDSSFGLPQLGAYGALSLSYRPFDFISLNGLAGYKSDGYVLGEPIEQSFVWRAGLTWHM